MADLVHFSIPFSGSAEVFLFFEWKLGFPYEGKQLTDVSVPNTAGGGSFKQCPSHPLQHPLYAGTSQTKGRAMNAPEQGCASLFSHGAETICIY